MTKRGFTLLELIIIIAIVGAIVAITATPLMRFRQAQALQNTTNLVLTVLTEARSKTLAGNNNTNYSVRLESDRAIVFEGASYESGAFSNQLFLYESPVILGTVLLAQGGSTITFDRLRGTTSDHGTLQLQLPDGTTRIITITPAGSVTRN